MGSSQPPAKQPDSNPFDIGIKLLEEIPGVKILEDITKLLDTLGTDLGKLLALAGSYGWLGWFEQLFKHAGKAGDIFQKDAGLVWEDFSMFGIGTLFETMLKGGLLLDETQLMKDAGDEVKTVDTMLTFVTMLPIGISALQTILKSLLGQRAGEAIGETIGKLPEEMGLTWALGMVLDRSFEAALGTALEEAIYYQKRPNRLEWPILRQLFRQHVIEPDVAREHLAHLGFQDKTIGHILKLDEQQLPVADLQRLYEYDVIKAGDVETYLKHQGFTDTDAGHLKTLYIDNIEHSAGLELRSTYRALFRNYIVDEGTYRGILASTNMPKLEIEDDVKAINDEHTLGRIHNTVAAIKTQYQHNHMDIGAATNNLQQLGYTLQAAQDLITAWTESDAPKRMSTAKILSYWYSGVMTDRGRVYDTLISHNIRPEDANFLIDNPAAGGAHVRKLTPALVTQAYLDGVIQQGELGAAYKKAGVDESALGDMEAVAAYKYAHQKRKPGEAIPLTRGDILDAFHVGIFSPDTAIQALEQLGYSDEGATLLVEIKNKGPLTQAAPSAVRSIEQAIEILTSAGYAVHPPPNPLIGEAESLLAQAGYTWTPPPYNPPTITPIGVIGGIGEGH